MIATNWSGYTDFFNAGTPIPWTIDSRPPRPAAPITPGSSGRSIRTAFLAYTCESLRIAGKLREKAGSHPKRFSSGGPGTRQ